MDVDRPAESTRWKGNGMESGGVREAAMLGAGLLLLAGCGAAGSTATVQVTLPAPVSTRRPDLRGRRDRGVRADQGDHREGL
jgi:hypothetical protein